MTQIRALVVDDEQVARETARRMLESLDYEVTTAASGEEGLDLFGRTPCQVVVTDINMPGIDGLELVRRITDQDLDAACVVMTVRVDQDAAIEAMRSGAYGFLHKPFDSEQLHDAVNKALRIRDRLVLARRLERELQRSRQERQSLESRFIDTEKLSALGQIAPRIAHEIKNPLQSITGNAELALHWLRTQGASALDEVRDHLEGMLPAAARIEGLVQQMFELGRPVEPRIEATDIPQLVSHLLDELRRAGVTKHCVVEESYGRDVPSLELDGSQIEQVFQNLILNAVHAMEGCDTRVLSVRVVVDGEGWVITEIADTGCGIEPAALQTIFQPFFTTKSEGKGTGLGLSIVKSVIERHGGRLHVASTPGEGSQFSVVLPTRVPDVAARTASALEGQPA